MHCPAGVAIQLGDSLLRLESSTTGAAYVGNREIIVRGPPILATVIGPEGFIEPGRLSVELRVTTELALAAGLSRNAISKTTRSDSPALREMTEILDRALPWRGSPAMALHLSHERPGFRPDVAFVAHQAGATPATNEAAPTRSVWATGVFMCRVNTLTNRA
jgi:hypothetical protein